MELYQYTNVGSFVQDSASRIARALATSSAPTLALSGGSTPKPIYEALAKEPLPFEQISLYQVDERYVPFTHTDSNWLMIMHAFGTTPFRSVHPFPTYLPLEEAVTQYPLPKAPFTVTVLGIGPDGHFASLFPGSSALFDRTSSVLHTTTDAFAVRDRLTLGLRPILESTYLFILLGAGKEAVLTELTKGALTPEEFPAKYLLEHPQLMVCQLQ